MKRLFIFLFLIVGLADKSVAQLALYNSRTLYDALENPSQKSFYTDSSKQFAFNFFFPTISLSSTASGPGLASIKNILINNVNDASSLAINKGEFSHFAFNSNVYLLSFRWFKRVKYEQEAGFSWQIRTDAWGKVSNETMAIFDSFDRFPDNNYEGIFNNRGYMQSYHQFGFSYRENFTKRVGLGVKISLLSGMAYTSGRINYSDLDINRTLNEYTLGFSGNFKSTLKDGSEGNKMLYPNFKNPGLSFSASVNVKFKKGWYLLANVKDLGFIHWNKENAKVYNFSRNIFIDNANSSSADNRLSDAIDNVFESGFTKKGFTTVTNSKLEVLLNKNFGSYHPNLLVSKNIWYAGGNMSLINNVLIKNHVISITPSYNFFNFVDVGAQYLYKTPNWEFFIGSDQLFKSIQLGKGLGKDDISLVKGAMASGFYIGLAGKFGKLMEHPLNANNIPGISSKEEGNSFFRKLFGKKK